MKKDRFYWESKLELSKILKDFNKLTFKDFRDNCLGEHHFIDCQFGTDDGADDYVKDCDCGLSQEDIKLLIDLIFIRDNKEIL